MARALVHHHPWLRASPVIFEPCAGRGALGFALMTERCSVKMADIKPRSVSVRKADTISSDDGWINDADVVTNPPFSRAAELWRRAAAHKARSISLLVRLNWLERAGTRQDIPDPHRVIILPRITKHMFVGKTSDSLTVLWATWFLWRDRPHFESPDLQSLSRDQCKGFL